jgi:hypothetical protein
MLLSLWLPVVLVAVALFFASFLSWMIFQLHKDDWKKLPSEDATLAHFRENSPTPGNYMFPMADTPAEQATPEFQKKWNENPRGVMTFFHKVSMGRNLGLTFLAFVVVSWTLAYLASIAFKPGAEFLDVFRFVFTTALLTFLTGIVQYSIWFQVRIVGHVVESLAYAVLAGAIFAALWPAA